MEMSSFAKDRRKTQTSSRGDSQEGKLTFWSTEASLNTRQSGRKKACETPLFEVKNIFLLMINNDAVGRSKPASSRIALEGRRE